jgi:hypothetical protein
LTLLRENVSVSKKPTIIFLSLVVALVSCNRERSPVSSRLEISAAEYEVLTTWIDASFTGKEPVGKGVTKVVIFDTTQSGDDERLGDENGKRLPWDKTAESLHVKDPALQSSALDAFRKVNT